MNRPVNLDRDKQDFARFRWTGSSSGGRAIRLGVQPISKLRSTGVNVPMSKPPTSRSWPASVDQGFEEASAQVGQTPKRADLVGAHQGRVAGHISGQNSSESAFQTRSPSPTRLMTEDRRIHAVRTVVECPLLAISGLSDSPLRMSAYSQEETFAEVKILLSEGPEATLISHSRWMAPMSAHGSQSGRSGSPFRTSVISQEPPLDHRPKGMDSPVLGH